MNPEDVHNYLFDRGEGYIERWHAWPTIRRESLAEHSFFVIKNALFISMLLRDNHIIMDVDDRSVMITALLHDITEKFTGDVSGVAKRLYPELKETLTKIEDSLIKDIAFDALSPFMQDIYKFYASAPFYRIESQIVKYCDVLDAHIFVTTEAKMGNSLMEEHITNTQGFLEAMQWPWLQTLREKYQLP